MSTAFCPQGLHPLHICPEQNRSDLHWGAGHHLQGSPLCSHLCPPPLELWWSAGEDLGLSTASAHVRFSIHRSGKDNSRSSSWCFDLIWFIWFDFSFSQNWRLCLWRCVEYIRLEYKNLKITHQNKCDANVVFLLLFFCSYTKPKGQLPDYTSPVVLPDGRTSVEDFCLKIHKNLIKELK